MAKGTLNKVILIGRLGSDPETRYMPNGSAVTNVTVATNDGYKDKQTGAFVESTEWHRVAVFGKLAEIAGEYLRKGSLVYFEGRIRTRKWQDKNGQDRYTTEIIANEMQLLGSKSESAGTNNRYDQAPPPAAPAAPSAPAKAAPAPKMEDLDNFDDDIPF